MQDCKRFLASELFASVQLQRVFRDSKTFADAIPKHSYAEALEAFAQSQPDDKDLLAFVHAHFDVSEPNEVIPSGARQNLHEFIERTWQDLTKPADRQDMDSSLLKLPHDYLIPGGRFQEIYYWDSYFSALGLLQSGHGKLVKNMLDNFIYLQQTFGIIPNGNRAYYLSRSQPPILALMVDLLSAADASFNPLEYLPALITEYDFWTKGASNPRAVVTANGFVASRYWDDNAQPRPESYFEDIELASKLPEQERADFYRNLRAACESGWDFSSRWLSDPNKLSSICTTDILPVDLNALLAISEKSIMRMAKQTNQSELEGTFAARYEARLEFFNQTFWQPHAACYADVNIDDLRATGVMSLAGAVPLFALLATQEQAKKVASQLATNFLQKGGLVTTLHSSSQQWDAPNGWAPLQWFAVEGLKHYGYDSLANEIAQKWVDNIRVFYQANGVIMEKYNVVDPNAFASGGEYDVQLGFGWTNGVTSALMHMLNK